MEEDANDKAERVKCLFQSEFTSRSVEHDSLPADWHKYTIRGEPTHGFFLSPEFLAQTEPAEIVQQARSSGAIYTCKASDNSVWLCLSPRGFEQVDENFVK